MTFAQHYQLIEVPETICNIWVSLNSKERCSINTQDKSNYFEQPNIPIPFCCRHLSKMTKAVGAKSYPPIGIKIIHESEHIKAFLTFPGDF